METEEKGASGCGEMGGEELGGENGGGCGLDVKQID